MFAADVSYSTPFTKMLPNWVIRPYVVIRYAYPEPWIPASEVPALEIKTRHARAVATTTTERANRPARQISMLIASF